MPAVANDIFGKFAEVLEEELRHGGVGLVIASSGWEKDGEVVALESLRARGVDAFQAASLSEQCAGAERDLFRRVLARPPGGV